MRPMGITLPLSMWRDRETGKVYALHSECEREFFAYLDSHGISPLARFAPMGPTDGECHWGDCGVST